MFWLAECAETEEPILDDLTAAAHRATDKNPKDGNPHGIFMREVLPWDKLEFSILLEPCKATSEQAHVLGEAAYERLCSVHPNYKKI